MWRFEKKKAFIILTFSPILRYHCLALARGSKGDPVRGRGVYFLLVSSLSISWTTLQRLMWATSISNLSMTNINFSSIDILSYKDFLSNKLESCNSFWSIFVSSYERLKFIFEDSGAELNNFRSISGVK